MSRKAHMWHRRIIANVPTKGDEMTSDDNWLENAVAGNSVGKSEVELRAQRAYTLEGLVTALAVENTRRQFGMGRRKRTGKDKKRRSIRD